MKIVYDRINDMRGNLITVTAEGVSLGELARIDLSRWTAVSMPLSCVLKGIKSLCRFFKTHVGFPPGTKSPFLNEQMQATFGDALLGRRLSGAGMPIDGGPEIHRGADQYRPALLQSCATGLFLAKWCAPISR